MSGNTGGKMIKVNGISKKLLVDLARAATDVYQGSGGSIPIYRVYPSTVYKEVNGVKLGLFNDMKGKLVIIFRGTNGSSEWISNFKFFFDSFYGAKVEHGFLEGFNNVKDFIEDYILEENNKTMIHTVHVVGHSRGAAVATLMAYHLSKRIKNVICVALASPRVGNRKFKKQFNAEVPNSYRIKYANDIVTKVPWDKLMRYVHCGCARIWVGKPSFWEKIKHPIRSFFGNPCDHWPQYYVKALEKEISE